MADRARRAWAAGLLGFALGGFLDGILLHQVLQWHHLLSGWIPGGTLDLERLQVWWDGLFHAAHYLVLALGLALLWGGGGAIPAGWFAIGFGAWHVLDAVVNHWALGLHRIRQDSPQPLLWDLVFFALGLAAIGLGTAWRRRPAGLARGPAALVLLLAAGGAALPARGPAFLAYAMPAEQAVLLAAMADARLAGLGDGLAVLATADAPRLRRAALALGARPAPVPLLPGQCLTGG
ncbi:DUF2243 domain-containing protein [Paracraurococcus lichenis]|uniref:DUF2243 domain-containing protein n=1 Tax=Paracraurococcus lichenis TaxID=3064888 RepID=A0ABT9DYZ2_9PROT|nr:DUF2243 domain-containing protein [Paracraurococcus sp. LOR1-02]MDO9709120.1 DUF2243 domain-containing protein [Paracraurococcus sp. LOR1-02]